MLFDYSEKHYFSELDRKDKLNRQVSVPMALFALYVSLAGAAIPDFDITQEGTIISSVLAVTSALCMVPLLKNFLSFFGHQYEYMDMDASLVEWQNDIRKLNQSSKNYDAADQVMKDFLVEDYLICVSKNAEANDLKAGSLYRSNFWIISALLIGSAAYFSKQILGV